MKLINTYQRFALIFLSVYLCIFTIRNIDYSNLANVSITVLTTEVCAGIFNSTTGSLVSDEKRASNKEFLNGLKSANPSFGIATLINDPNQKFDVNNLINPIIRTSGVWFFMLIVSIIGWWCYFCCCCCDKCCPPCKSCKRDVEKKPITKMELYVPAVIGILMAGIIIASGIAGQTYAPDVGFGIKAMRCALMSSMQTIIVQSPKFVGLTGISAKLDNLSSKLGGFISATESVFGVDGDESEVSKIQSKKDKITTAIISIPQALYLGNPTYLQGTGIMSWMTDRVVIQNQQDYAYIESQGPGFGGIIPGEAIIISSYYDALLLVMNGLQSGAQPFFQSGFTEQISAGVTQCQLLVTQATDQGNKLYESTKPMATYAVQASDALIAAFSLCLIPSVLIIFGSFVIIVLKIFKARLLIHIGWCLYCIVMILGFLLGAVLNPVSVVSLEVCDYIDTALNSQVFFNKNGVVTENRDPQMKAMLTECFFGAGDIMTVIGVRSQLEQFSSITPLIDQFSSGLSSASSTKQTFLRDALKKNQEYISSIANATIKDLSSTQTPISESDQATAWQGVLDSQIDIVTFNKQADDDFQNFIKGISDWIKDIQDVLNIIIDPVDGIFEGIDCRIMRTIFIMIYDGMCVLFLPAIYRATVLMLLISVAMFIGSLAGCCFGLRVSKYSTDKVENIEKVQNESIDKGKGEEEVELQQGVAK